MESSNLVRTKNGVVLTSGITSFDGNRQGGEYIKFKNPQVVNLEGQGIDQKKLDRIIANATKAKRDGVVLLNLRHSNTVNSALHNVAVPITRYPTKSIVAVPGVDLGTYFSGGGTLEASVYESVFPKIAVEYNAEIASVYRANHGDHVQVKDVQEVDPTSLKDVQWFHASPVCKNFSDANPNAIETVLDKKTGKAVVDAIDHSRPPIVTIENVAKYRESESFTAILDALRRNGYEFDYGVYKTSKYGGGTSRQRLIVRAVRGFALPPIIKTDASQRTWYESIKDIIDTLPISELAPNQLRKLEASKIDVRAMKTPVLFTQNSYHAVGITADKVFPSFTTSGGTYRILMPGGQVRAITGVAFRRMMGLPDAYLLPESEPLARKILANGVPAELSQVIMAPLADAYARHNMRRLVQEEMRRPDTGDDVAYQEDGKNRRVSNAAMLSYVAQTTNISESDVQKLIDNGSLPKPIDGYYDPITFRALQARVSVAIATGKDGKLNWDNAVRFVPIIRDLNKKLIPFDTDGALEFSELVHWLKTRKGELFPMPNVRGEKITVERMIRTFTNSNVAPAEYVVGGDRSGLMYDPRILSALETYTNMRHNGYAVEFIKGVLNPEGEQRTLEGGVGVKEFLEILNSGRDKPITQDIITNWRVKGGYIPAMLNDPAHGIGKLFTPDHLLIAEKIADLIDSGVSQSVTKGQLKARLIADPEYVEAFTRIVTHPWYQSTSTTTMASIKEAKPIMRMADVIAAIAKEVEPNKFTVANYQALERSGNIPKGLKPSDGTTRRQYNDDYVKLAVMALNPKYRGKTAEFRKQDPEYLKLWNKINDAVRNSESGSEEAVYQEADNLFPSQRRTVETSDMPGAPMYVERIRPKQLPPRNAWFWGAIDLYNDITRLPLSGDLAFQNLQGGIIGLSNPLVGLKAFKAGLQGFAPNMQIEVNGQLYGSRKFGRETYHAAGEAMRRNPMYKLAKEAGLPLAMFEIDARLQEAREIELHNLKMTNPNATMKDVKIGLMDIDELGTVDEWYSKNRITRHLPMQGQFERFNSLVHDTLLLTQFDNWVKVLLSKGYQPNTTMFNNALKDTARVLAVSVGDIKYSTNPETDAAASRIAKIFFTAPRWLMSRALIDPFINQMVSNSSIFARLREIMGEDNPAFNLYNGDKEVAKLGQSMWLRIAGLEAMLAIMAWVFSNWYPDTEVNTDIQPGRIRIGDFQIDPMAGLIDHYKLAGRLAKAVFSVDPRDASRAEKEGIPQWMMAVKDISKELSYKASPGITFLQAISGTNDLKAQADNFFTAPWEAKSINVVGEPLFERSASAKIFYDMIKPRLRELFGDAVADDIPISNMMMDRIPMALPGFIESFASAKEYDRDPWVYALADTIPNFFGFKVDVMPTEARKDRAKDKNMSSAEDSPTLLRLLAEGRANEAFTGTVKSSPSSGNVNPW
jgi:site-specific DNA-cytosine methylase